MNSRRKFILQSGLATTAFLAAKPFSVIAKAASPFSGNATSGSFMLLHTAHMNSCTSADLVNYITTQKTRSGAIVATAGNKISSNFHSLQYDITPHDDNKALAVNGEYKIIKKGSVQTGIIMADPSDNNVIENVKNLSEKLKSEQGCQVVVCLSQLGYKNQNNIDDLGLAAASSHLDIIIGGHPTNFPAYPIIAQNKVLGEVIIHTAAGSHTGYGQIEIEFDEQGKKRFLNLTNKVA